MNGLLSGIHSRLHIGWGTSEASSIQLALPPASARPPLQVLGRVWHCAAETPSSAGSFERSDVAKLYPIVISRVRSSATLAFSRSLVPLRTWRGYSRRRRHRSISSPRCSVIYAGFIVGSGANELSPCGTAAALSIRIIDAFSGALFPEPDGNSRSSASHACFT